MGEYSSGEEVRRCRGATARSAVVAVIKTGNGIAIKRIFGVLLVKLMNISMLKKELRMTLLKTSSDYPAEVIQAGPGDGHRPHALPDHGKLSMHPLGLTRSLPQAKQRQQHQLLPNF